MLVEIDYITPILRKIAIFVKPPSHSMYIGAITIFTGKSTFFRQINAFTKEVTTNVDFTEILSVIANKFPRVAIC